MFSKHPLLIPFFLFLSAFLVDKLFLLNSFPLYYLTTASFINFQHKEKLTKELKNYLENTNTKRKKTLLILGNSRTMSFDNKYISKNYPEWILFNFSVPGGTQDYFLYSMEKFKKENIRPDAILFAVTPQGMNAKPSVMTDEVMVFGLPFNFVMNYFYYYSIDQLTNYLGKKLFVTYRFRPKLKIIGKRMDDMEMVKFTSLLIYTNLTLEKERGSILNTHEFNSFPSEEVIQKNAESIWKDFFEPFVLDKKALFFLKRSIEIAKELNIPHIGILWPPVSPALKKLKEEKIVAIENTKNYHKKTVKEVWGKEMLNIAQEYKIHWYDFNFTEPMKCNYFFDASHLSSYCLKEYTDKIFAKLK